MTEINLSVQVEKIWVILYITLKILYITLKIAKKKKSKYTTECEISTKANTDLQNYNIDEFIFVVYSITYISLSSHIQ